MVEYNLLPPDQFENIESVFEINTRTGKETVKYSEFPIFRQNDEILHICFNYDFCLEILADSIFTCTIHDAFEDSFNISQYIFNIGLKKTKFDSILKFKI